MRFVERLINYDILWPIYSELWQIKRIFSEKTLLVFDDAMVNWFKHLRTGTKNI